MSSINTQATPNPNSLKITTDDDTSFIEDGLESFSTAQEAFDHPLGHALFSVQGVENVFIMPAFVTVTKHPASDWSTLLPQLRDAFKSYFEQQTG